MLEIRRAEEIIRRVRLAEVHEVILFGQIEVTSAVIAALARRGIDLIYLTVHGYYRARLVGSRSPQAALQLAQLRRTFDDSFVRAVASAMVAGKLTHQRQVLLRAQRRLKDESLADTLARLRLLIEECQSSPELDRLRGLEGQAAALYFSQFGKLILVPDFSFVSRSRRPPRDPVNACLSFGYTLLGNIIETELLRCGLNPMIGFLHQPAHNRNSLALDLLEEMRPWIDTLVLRLVNRRQLGPGDFSKQPVDVEAILAESDNSESVPETEGIYLNDAGRKIFLQEYYGRLRETIYYPPRQGTYALREIIREQAYHLARVIQGTDPNYRPFVPT